MSKLQVPGAALSEVSTHWFAAGSPPPTEPPYIPPLTTKLPAYCRLDATLDRRTGADGKTYGIGFAVALPADWNGTLPAAGRRRAERQRGCLRLGRTGQNDAALARGFAVATTDTGHKGQAFDATFMQEQQASLDFAYQAVGRIAVLARQIVAQHYGKPADHSYFAGLLDRRPRGHADGAALSHRTSTASSSGRRRCAPTSRGIGDEWVATMLNQAAPKDASGKPDLTRALSDADRKTVIDGLLNACDADDGVKDGMVFDPIGLPLRSEDARVHGREDGRLPLEGAGGGDREGVRRAEGLEGPPGLSRASCSTPASPSTQGIPGLLARQHRTRSARRSRPPRWTSTGARKARRPIRRCC